MAFFPSLEQNFIPYRSSKVSSRPDCIFEIHQLWQSGFSRVYSNCCCSCWFEPEIIKIGQSSHKLYSNNIVNFQESMIIINACTKKHGNLLTSLTYLLSWLSFWKNKYQIHSYMTSNMDDFEMICIHKHLPISAYFFARRENFVS